MVPRTYDLSALNNDHLLWDVIRGCECNVKKSLMGKEYVNAILNRSETSVCTFVQSVCEDGVSVIFIKDSCRQGNDEPSEV